MTEEKALDAVLNDKPCPEIWLDYLVGRSQGLRVPSPDTDNQKSFWQNRWKPDANFLWPIIEWDLERHILLEDGKYLIEDAMDLRHQIFSHGGKVGTLMEAVKRLIIKRSQELK